jgi:hypothetical protein
MQKMAKSITRTITSTKYTIGEFQDGIVHQVGVILMDGEGNDKNREKARKQAMKEYGKDSFIMAAETETCTRSMPIDVFIANSTIVENKEENDNE